MDTIQFSNSSTMPLFGLGTWRSTRDETYSAVYDAVKMGYRHIDCAYIYGNEDVVGQALADLFAQQVVSREELFITSKLWNDSHESHHVQSSLERGLRDLRLNYLDLYLVHWPVALRYGTQFPSQPSELLSPQQAPLPTTWAALEGCQKQGLCRHIGVSNFTESKLRELMTTAVQKPEMNQIELHPYLQQQGLVDFCRANGIHVTAYSPLGANKTGSLGDVPLLDNAILGEVAAKHSATPAQVALAWCRERGVVAIPKSVRVERLAENLASLSLQLDAEDMQRIATLDCNLRVTRGELWTMQGSPYTQEWLWG